MSTSSDPDDTSTAKPTDEWVTGDEPITSPQAGEGGHGTTHDRLDEAVAEAERPGAGGPNDTRRLDDLRTAEDAGDFGASGEPG